MLSKFKFLLIPMTLLFVCCNVFSEKLSLDDYLKLVGQNNNQLKAVEANIAAVKGKIAELDRVYSFYLSAGGTYTNDASGRPFMKPQNYYLDRTVALAYDLSVNKQFQTGTKFSLGFNGGFNQYDYKFSGTDYDAYDLAPFIGLEQSLFKDFNGGVTKASINQAKASAKSALYLLEYQKQNILLSAKVAYWNLSYAQTVVEFRKTSLDRTQKIYAWNEKRYKVDLAEKSDLLQAKAAVKSRELNLQYANESEEKARRDFNQLINIVDDKIIYELENFEQNTFYSKLKESLTKKGIRYDVLSALEDVESAKNAQITSQKTSGADLVLTGQAALNGLDEEFSKSFERVRDANKPTFRVGLRYTLPLDFGTRKTINKGYEAATFAAQKSAEYLKSQEQNDWEQLIYDWDKAKERLAIANEIQKIQTERHTEENNLLRKGRTTTYLVIQSEQDLDDAILSVFQGTLELIIIYEKANVLYGDNLDLNI